MLYNELLESCKEQFDDFFKNTALFENQFKWSEFNQQCYKLMFTENEEENIASVSDLKKKLPALQEMCKKCGDFYLPKRNESIPKYDVILGEQHELAIKRFLSKKLNAPVERADLENRSMPDLKLLNADGTAAAYFEIKFHAAPFIKAYNNTGRYCYEGSATLDHKKIEKQLELIKDFEMLPFC